MEKRRAPRLPIYMEVNYQRGEENVTSFLYDISRNGVFIHTSDPLDPGTGMDISFHIPGLNDPFNTQVTVVWNKYPEENPRPGMGVRFDSMSPDDRRRLDDFLEVFEEILGAN